MNGFGATAGSALAYHDRVQKIAFTGSTAVSQLNVNWGQKEKKLIAPYLKIGGQIDHGSGG